MEFCGLNAVRNDQFLKKAPAHQEKSALYPLKIKDMGLVNLGAVRCSCPNAGSGLPGIRKGLKNGAWPDVQR